MFGQYVHGFGSVVPTGGAGPTPSQYALSLASASTQYLTLADATGGGYNKSKFAISAWFNRSSADAMYIASHWSGSLQRAWSIRVDATGEISYTITQDGTSGYTLVTTAQYSTGTYYQLLAYYDGQNATAGDRLRLFVGQVGTAPTEITAFNVDTNPPQGDVHNSTGDIQVGYRNGLPWNGLIYQLALYSNNLPAVGDVNASGYPKDISTVTGLYWSPDAADGTATYDAVLGAASWTNNNTVTTSSTIPA